MAPFEPSENRLRGLLPPVAYAGFSVVAREGFISGCTGNMGEWECWDENGFYLFCFYHSNEIVKVNSLHLQIKIIGDYVLKMQMIGL